MSRRELLEKNVKKSTGFYLTISSPPVIVLPDSVFSASIPGVRAGSSFRPEGIRKGKECLDSPQATRGCTVGWLRQGLAALVCRVFCPEVEQSGPG